MNGFDSLVSSNLFIGLAIVFSVLLLIVGAPFSARVRKRGAVTSDECWRARALVGVLAFLTVFFVELAMIADSGAFDLLTGYSLVTLLCFATPCPAIFAILFVFLGLRCRV